MQVLRWFHSFQFLEQLTERSDNTFEDEVPALATGACELLDDASRSVAVGTDQVTTCQKQTQASIKVKLPEQRTRRTQSPKWPQHDIGVQCDILVGPPLQKLSLGVSVISSEDAHTCDSSDDEGGDVSEDESDDEVDSDQDYSPGSAEDSDSDGDIFDFDLTLK